jgi:uncharacterized sulfatase
MEPGDQRMMDRVGRRGVGLVVLAVLTALGPVAGQERPNILWITFEDASPDLGCYGAPRAVTPTMDRLAATAGTIRHTRAFAPIGVCAPSRSAIITGVWPTSLGTHPMRCKGTLPDSVRRFPEYLRQAGYWTSNNVKTDYNFDHRSGTWDRNSNTAHWRGRRPGQPFFSVFNITISHESQIRHAEAAHRKLLSDWKLKPQDPERIPLPPYHPDTPEVRRDWARYHDNLTATDARIAEILKELEDDGLADSTIIFVFSDHGAGMPRSKRWLYDSSTRVPLLVHLPRRWRSLDPGPGEKTSDRLISFLDLAPTVLTLAGVAVPDVMVGKPFLGPDRRSLAAAEPEFVFGFRDRMDERLDMVRSVRDRRFKYIRNYHPERPWFGEQFVSYMFEMPTMKVWQKLADERKLVGPQARFMAPTKPVEELYDTDADPWEITNLADQPGFRNTLLRLRRAHEEWRAKTIDLGLLSEADLRTRFGTVAPYEAVRLDPGSVPYADLARAADLDLLEPDRRKAQALELAGHKDRAVRRRTAFAMIRLPDDSEVTAALTRLSRDPAADVRIAALDALERRLRGTAAEVARERAGLLLPVKTLTADADPWIRLEAINLLDRIDRRTNSVGPEPFRARLRDSNEYVVRVAEEAVKRRGEKVEPPVAKKAKKKTA